MERQLRQILLATIILTLTISTITAMETDKRHKTKLLSMDLEDYKDGNITVLDKNFAIKYKNSFSTKRDGINLILNTYDKSMIEQNLGVLCKDIFPENNKFALFRKHSTHYLPYKLIDRVSFKKSKDQEGKDIYSIDISLNKKQCQKFSITSENYWLEVVYKQLYKKTKQEYKKWKDMIAQKEKEEEEAINQATEAIRRQKSMEAKPRPTMDGWRRTLIYICDYKREEKYENWVNLEGQYRIPSNNIKNGLKIFIDPFPGNEKELRLRDRNGMADPYVFFEPIEGEKNFYFLPFAKALLNGKIISKDEYNEELKYGSVFVLTFEYDRELYKIQIPFTGMDRAWFNDVLELQSWQYPMKKYTQDFSPCRAGILNKHFDKLYNSYINNMLDNFRGLNKFGPQTQVVYNNLIKICKRNVKANNFYEELYRLLSDEIDISK